MAMGIAPPSIGPDAGSKRGSGQIGQSDGFAGQNGRPMRTEVNNSLCDTHNRGRVGGLATVLRDCRAQIEAALSPHGTISA
jgi:hypothetical protein